MSVRRTNTTTSSISFVRRLAVIGGLATVGLTAATTTAGALPPGPVGPIPDLELAPCNPMPCTPPTTVPPWINPDIDDFEVAPADPEPPAPEPQPEPEPEDQPTTTVAPQGGGTGGGTGGSTPTPQAPKHTGGSNSAAPALATAADPAPIVIDTAAEQTVDPVPEADLVDVEETAASPVEDDKGVAMVPVLLLLAFAGALAIVAGVVIRRRRTA